jgi:hypothetical protein
MPNTVMLSATMAVVVMLIVVFLNFRNTHYIMLTVDVTMVSDVMMIVAAPPTEPHKVTIFKLKSFFMSKY